MRRLAACTAAAVTLALASSTPAEAGRYRVRLGDTLTGIAAAHGTTVRALARANGLDPSGVLLAGTTLHVPGGGTAAGGGGSYQVRWGDTLSAIAARYGTSVLALASANRLDPSGVLLQGTHLRVPGAGGSFGTSSYTVRRGDTLTALAARFGTTVRALARSNHLDPAGILPAGAHLVVPFAPQAAAAAAGTATVTQPWSVAVAIDYWSAHYGVDAHLARALAWMESGFQTGVVSPAGAWGVMQVLPSTWSYVESQLIGVPVAHTADGNIRVGVALLHHLLHVFGGDERLAVAAYYQGERAVERYGVLRVSEPYVADVLALRERM